MASSATDSQSKDKDIRQQLVQSGHVDVMISVGNNFFYTKSLPCSLWFFDKGKPAERLELQAQSNDLMATISRNMKEMGI